MSVKIICQNCKTYSFDIFYEIKAFKPFSFCKF